ncbi:tRNA uridine-5-carboxymethylaminomethyl(34) synthesis GTPase MnmE [uncultured Desulfovibrio sp.]|uniref:tRNA uridine-5-carboxymethylaminomethyl(34) synthesis GTPase MnmE n=1 Tax=uncultured Desulfovibrio sp. TaxID=167968 RepID=UPI002617EC53|nr:tRNA uridine-5-carboxymethylaminomethyl(34) synthesis GTPase MnmE [uncultured Desulfovibrio sp.]
MNTAAQPDADTIAAVATPPGVGAIGIVRLSGPRAKDVLAHMFLPLSPAFENFRPWRLHRGRVLDWNGEALDDVLAVFMPAPRTFTGEDTAEIHCHGGPVVVQAVLESALRHGARQALRGEFSRRAFVNGRMDLSQAEAVAELIAAPSREALRYGLQRLDGLLGQRARTLRERLESLRARLCLAVDFPEEETEGLEPEKLCAALDETATALRRLLAGSRRARVMQQGALVVLAGAVNAGKSSLLNALLGRNRALVTDIPGTTRDFLEEACELEGLPVRLTDTAGLRHDAGAVERLGVERSREKLAEADAVLLVLDGERLGEDGAASSRCPDPAAAEVLEASGATPLLAVWNKCDVCMPAVFPPRWLGERPCCAVSALSGTHVEELAARLRALLLADAGQAAPEDGLAPNVRQALALEAALRELEALRADVLAGQPYDCCAVRLDMAAAHLGEVIGLSSPAEMLNSIFAQFCIGK